MPTATPIPVAILKEAKTMSDVVQTRLYAARCYIAAAAAAVETLIDAPSYVSRDVQLNLMESWIVGELSRGGLQIMAARDAISAEGAALHAQPDNFPLAVEALVGVAAQPGVGVVPVHAAEKVFERVDAGAPVLGDGGRAGYDRAANDAKGCSGSEHDGLVHSASPAVITPVDGPRSDQRPITREEMAAMFGEAMPVEAVNLLFNANPDDTLGEIRARLRAIARRHKNARHGVDPT